MDFEPVLTPDLNFTTNAIFKLTLRYLNQIDQLQYEVESSWPLDLQTIKPYRRKDIVLGEIITFITKYFGIISCPSTYIWLL